MSFPNLESLAEAAHRWCAEHGVQPMRGQAAAAINVRNIRFYRTRGLIDGPDRGKVAPYGERHFLQLVSIRILQAKGLPLDRIQELLYGRGEADLRRILAEGSAAFAAAPRGQLPGAFAAGSCESWRVTPLDGDWMLISRSGRTLAPTQFQAILETLRAGASPAPSPTHR